MLEEVNNKFKDLNLALWMEETENLLISKNKTVHWVWLWKKKTIDKKVKINYDDKYEKLWGWQITVLLTKADMEYKTKHVYRWSEGKHQLFCMVKEFLLRQTIITS